MFFIIYWDGKKLRAYVPTDGNPWNTDTKEAYGNDEEKDEDKLDILYDSDEITKGCIKSRSHLDYYLDILSNQLKIIESINKNKCDPYYKEYQQK